MNISSYFNILEEGILQSDGSSTGPLHSKVLNLVLSETRSVYNLPANVSEDTSLARHLDDSGNRTVFFVEDGIHYPIMTVTSGCSKVVFDIFTRDPLEFYEKGLHYNLPFTNSSVKGIDYSTMGAPVTPILRIAADYSNGMYKFDPEGKTVTDEDVDLFHDRIVEVYGEEYRGQHDFLRAVPLGGNLLALLYSEHRLDMPLSLYDTETGKVWFDFFRHSPEIFNDRCQIYSNQQKGTSTVKSKSFFQSFKNLIGFSDSQSSSDPSDTGFVVPSGLKNKDLGFVAPALDDNGYPKAGSTGELNGSGLELVTDNMGRTRFRSTRKGLGGFLDRLLVE